MPPKRAIESTAAETTPTSTPPTSAKKAKTASPSISRQAWSATEDRKFLEAMDRIMKSHMWNEIKQDGELSKRGANGIRSHWDAMYRKLKKG